MVAVEHDHARAGAEDRRAGGRELAQRVAEALALDAERHRRRLAAGDHEAVEALEARRACGPRARRRRARAARARAPAKSPCRARTPTSGTRRYQPRLASSWPSSSLRVSSEVIAVPRPSEARATRAGSSKWVVASTIARGAGRRVLGLEDARAHEHALGAELHHQRRVGRGGDAAGAEQHDRELAVARDLADEVQRRLVLLGGRRELRRRPSRSAP